MEWTALITSMSWEPVLCFIVGFLLVVFEMFHPGFGAPGIVGGILLILGVIISAENLMQAFIMIIVILLVLGILLTIVLQSATKGRLSRVLILKEAQNKETGYIGTEDLQFLIDKEGISMSVLRPAGIADFDGVKMDVVSQGEYIPSNKKVRIIQVQGRRIVVKEVHK